MGCPGVLQAASQTLSRNWNAIKISQCFIGFKKLFCLTDGKSLELREIKMCNFGYLYLLLILNTGEADQKPPPLYTVTVISLGRTSSGQDCQFHWIQVLFASLIPAYESPLGLRTAICWA